MAKKPKKQEPPLPEPSKIKTKSKSKSSSPAPPTDEPKKPARGLAIGENFGWTGKLPVTLLNEHCQKQKWGRCTYDMVKRGKGFICVVTLNWENPKTKEVISIKFWPNYEPRDTTNEARHMTATFVLHRINYIKNMKMLLPIIFRDYWSDLEGERTQLLKENRTLHDIRYNVNPFVVHLQQQELSKKKEKERQIKEQNELKVKKPTISLGSSEKLTKKSTKTTSSLISEISKFPKFPRKAWDNAPFIDIPSDVRSALEVAIRQHIDWIDEDEKTSNLLKSNERAEQYRSQLVDLGFRKSHIEEAFDHTCKFVDALEWLIFHVPEDDLPPVFMKNDRDKSVELKISKDIRMEYTLKRLSHSGFDHDEILQALKENDNNEFATCIKLTHSLIPQEYQQTEQENSDEELWQQEIEAIEVSGTQVKIESNRKTISILLSPQDIPQKNVLSVKLFKSDNYPHQIPGIHIIVLDSKYKLANYVKLSIVRQLIGYIYENQLIGECMIFSIVEWLQENISRIIKDPGKLVPSTMKKLKISSNGKLVSKSQSNKKTKHNLSPQDLSRLEQEHIKRQSSNELKSSLTKRAKLPAWNKRQDLISTIISNKVTLITGETGSGKSTQVVQFILDHLNSQGDFTTKIMCTQPRRISTIGLAERISEERVDKVGNETGYVIRGENRTTSKTRLAFVTTGVLLRMLQSFLSGKGDVSNVFDDLGYIFIDEVHERSVDGDFLLIILKKISNRFKNLKFVLMSATINVEKFVNFFNTPLKHIHIEGRTFPIKDYYLDGILDEIGYSIQNNDGELIRPSADSHFFNIGTLNYDLIAKLTSHIDEKLRSENNDGSILIFLPGIMEINQTIRAINNVFQSVLTLPLHSALTSNEQRRVFKSAPRGIRKVVVSTNVAETSITIPDCVVVIDTGRSKTMFFDAKLNTTKLVENWCSQAEISQRRGRSGRITNGNCYHLYTQTTVDSMIPQPIPEIKRTRLENLYLVVKAMGISQVEEFLQSGLDAPDSTSLAISRKFLHDLGALVDDKLSHLGEYLSYLPTDPASGKLLVLGCIFGCVDVCLTLAAISSTGSPFINSFDNRDKIKQIQRKFASDQGDLIAMANAYSMYQEYREQKKNIKRFIADNFLSYTTLNDITSTRSQYVSLLKDLGFVPIHYNPSESKFNRNGNNSFIIRAIITGAFYPQVAGVQYPDPKYFKSAQGSIAMDPDARSIKFWIRNEGYMKEIEQGKDIKEQLPASRVFIHPSSVIFNDNNSNFTVDEEFLAKVSNEDGTINYQQARDLMELTPQVNSSSQTLRSSFVVFRSSHHTSKLFVRDITPTTTLIALLFGGDIQYNLSNTNSTTSPGIVVDSWLPIRTWCKNAVLIKRLRKLVDGLIEERLRNPQYEVELLGANNDDILSTIEKFVSVT